MGEDGATYASAGVDINAANQAVEGIGDAVRETYTADVVRGHGGGFGGMFRLTCAGAPNHILVSTIDGVGTKVQVAEAAGRFGTIGPDIVYHCANDLLCQGATPLFMLDYYGACPLQPDIMTEVVKGLAHACSNIGVALIGGETAEMPGTYVEGRRDLVGCMVGIVHESNALAGIDIWPGCTLIGLASNGLHTNGYSLARKLTFETACLTISDMYPWGVSVADELLRVHLCYSAAVLPLVRDHLVEGIAHITGGGFYDNITRVLPDECRAIINPSCWDSQDIFRFLVDTGKMSVREAYRTFNMGIGMVLVVRETVVNTVMSRLSGAGKTAWVIGEVVRGERGVQIQGE